MELGIFILISLGVMKCKTCKLAGKDNIFAMGTTDFRADGLRMHQLSKAHSDAEKGTSMRTTPSEMFQPVCIKSV